MRIFLHSIMLLSMSSISLAATAPFNTTPLINFSPTVSGDKNSARLKVSLAVSDYKDQGTIQIGGIVVCSNSACYKTDAPNYVKTVNTLQGKSALVVDATIPTTATITSIYFQPSAGEKTIEGSIKLDKPLVIEKGYYGGEVFITLAKKNVLNRSIYYPAGSSGNLFNSENQSIYYDPKFTTKTSLKYGAILTIPAGALTKPQVFSVAVHDTGMSYPLIDIYPYINLNKPAIIERKKLVSTTDVSNRTGITPSKTKAVQQSEGIYNRDINPADDDSLSNPTVQLSKTGVIESSANFSSPIESNSNIQAVAAADSRTCEELIIASAANIIEAMKVNGAATINFCRDISPYVNIVVVNTRDSRIRFSIPYKYFSLQPNYHQLVLQPITDNAFQSIVTVNGFTWSGDQGDATGQKGLADGYLISGGTRLGDNVNGGGLSYNPSTTPSGGNKFVMGYGNNFEKLAYFETPVVAANFGDYSSNLISSSTSIVKNGNCTTQNSFDRWSAIGAQLGRMVVISSTSSGTTSAAQLCPIFKGLGIQNALRLDGGPSASMTLDGILLNPLTGLASLKYGSIRKVAYPLRISY